MGDTAGEVSASSSAVRPTQATGAKTQHDIHVSEQGQHSAPAGPTRIATWRPLPDKTIIKKEFTPTPEQLIQINNLKEYVESSLVLKPSDGKIFEEYGNWEKKFLDRSDTYSRYMRASDWKLDEAKRRIKETLEWRRSYKPDLIKPSEIAKEAEGGKVVVNGFDTDGRPIVWLRPSRENTKPSPTQIRHLIFQLERAIDLLPEGVEKLALVVDYKGATSGNNPSRKTASEVIHILQNHYCERMGRGVVVNVPFYLQAFFSMLKPLLDPKTKEKIKFNPLLKNMIPSQQLDSQFGGDHQYLYDSRVYLPALCHYCGIKEDGTREDVIPKDIPSTKPDELQRALTLTHGPEMDEAAEHARLEAEEKERQDEEAAHFEKLNSEAPVRDDVESPDLHPIANTDEGTNTSTSTQGTGMATAAAAGGAAVAGVAGASLAATAQQDKLGSDTKSPEPVSASTSALGPVKTADTAPASKDSNITSLAGPPAQATAASPSNSASDTLGRKRGGWKLFSSKRGLDKQGNPTGHKHKHISKAFCMHKGAVDPSKLEAVPVSSNTTSSTVNHGNSGTGGERSVTNGDGRIKIAPEAITREERVYTNAPLATNATFGPEAYQTAMEAQPAEGEGDNQGGDYFTNIRKIPPIKPADVEHHKDEAKIVERPSEILQRLHEGGTGDLTLAFEVKEPPVAGAAAATTDEINTGNGEEIDAANSRAGTALKEETPHEAKADITKQTQA